MSFITGGAVELLYASTQVGGSFAATSETQLNDTATMGVQARIEPDFWLPNNNQVGKAIHITARGVVSSLSGSPTFTFTVRGGAPGNGGPILLASSAISIPAGITSGLWGIEGDIIVSVMGAPGAATVQGYGNAYCRWFGSTFCPLMTGTASTFDTSITNYISVNCLISISGQTVGLQQLLVYGLN